MIIQNKELIPKVSVVIPCYNHGEYIDEAVDSVLSQAFQNFEIIIVNDGSADEKTCRILQDYNRPKTQVIHTENAGPSQARNSGIKLAKGEYILPLDADDKISHTYLEKAVNILENNENMGIVYCEAEYLGRERTDKWPLPEYSFPEILLRNMIFCSAFFRKSDWKKVGGYKINMEHGLEDYDFWLSLIEMGREVYRIPEILFSYRYNSEQIRGRTASMINRNYMTKCYAQLYRNHTNLYSQNIEYIFEEIINFQESKSLSITRALETYPFISIFLKKAYRFLRRRI